MQEATLHQIQRVWRSLPNTNVILPEQNNNFAGSFAEDFAEDFARDFAILLDSLLVF
ncbi:MAG TPA: hypothetical protein V6C65_40045 [Allocoleopsis sp.]